MFTKTRMFAAVSIMAITFTADTSAQQMSGSAKFQPAIPVPDLGGYVPDADSRERFRVLADNIVPGTPYAVFIGNAKGAPVLLVDAGIVPEVGELALNMHIGLQHDSLMKTYFQNGDVTISCPAGPDQDGGLGDMSLQVTDQGTAQLVQDVLSNGDQGLGMSGQAAAQGTRGETKASSRKAGRARGQHAVPDAKFKAAPKLSSPSQQAP